MYVDGQEPPGAAAAGQLVCVAVGTFGTWACSVCLRVCLSVSLINSVL